MNIHTFLFDIIKVLATISIGMLSLYIGFADKLQLNLKTKTVGRLMIIVLLSLISTLAGCIISGFFIFSDIEYSILREVPTISKGSKISTILTLIPFTFVLISLARLGAILVNDKTNKKYSGDRKASNQIYHQ